MGAVAHHEGVKRGEQQEAYNEQGAEQAYAEPAPAPTPAPTDYAPPPVDPASELDHLSQLHDSGVLTDDEFAAAKTKVLGT